MGKIAFVFAGQGDQYSGMGKELYEQYQAAQRVFALCDALRPGTSFQCFHGSEEELRETKNTQPCLFAMELAALEVLKEAGLKADCVAGFSLGELTAAAAASLLTPEDAFCLVRRRGELMQQAAEQQDTSMAAVVKLSEECVREICAQFSQVYPVNFSAPGLISVSGLTSQMQEFYGAVKAAGGRALPLKVKGAFHSPFMDSAAAEFAGVLEETAFFTPVLSIYSNATGECYGNDPKLLLAQQICKPVLWEKIIRNMLNCGVDTFIEIGPAKTLSGMIKKIDAAVKTYAVCNLSDWLEEVTGC